MSKTALIISREYFTRVKKKSFLITTILVPVVIIAFYAAIIAITLNGGSDRQAIAIIDKAGLLNDILPTKNKKTNFTFIKNETETSFISKYKLQGYQAFLYIPAIDSGFILHSQSSVSLTTSSALEKMINKAIEEKRLLAQGIDPAKYKSIAADVSIENTIDTKQGGKKKCSRCSLCCFLCLRNFNLYDDDNLRYAGNAWCNGRKN